MDFVDICFVMYFLAVSIISFIVVGVDKLCAKYKKSRVPEKTIFLLSILLGSASVYIAMSLFNHKTQKNSFVFLIPMIFALQCFVFYLLHKYDILF